MNEDKLQIGKDRLVQVYKYLQALNSHRNPAKRQIKEQPWLLWLRQLPDHPAVDIASIEEPKPSTGDDSKTAPAASEGANFDYLLRLSRPKITKAPLPSPLGKNGPPVLARNDPPMPFDSRRSRPCGNG